MKLNFWPFKKRQRFPVTEKNDFGFTPALESQGHLLCPNCGSSQWIEGPEGGGSQNLQCGKCFKYYNYMGFFGLQDIGDRSHIFGIKPPLNEKH